MELLQIVAQHVTPNDDPVEPLLLLEIFHKVMLLQCLWWSRRGEEDGIGDRSVWVEAS